jgi:hypothetical protein
MMGIQNSTRKFNTFLVILLLVFATTPLDPTRLSLNEWLLHLVKLMFEGSGVQLNDSFYELRYFLLYIISKISYVTDTYI